MPIDPPTIGEIMRRLDSISQQLGDITKEIKADRAEAARLYVTRELYMAQRQADAAVVADLAGDIKKVETATEREIEAIKRDREADRAQRRQLVMWLVGITVTVLLGIAALIVSIVSP